MFNQIKKNYKHFWQNQIMYLLIYYIGVLSCTQEYFIIIMCISALNVTNIYSRKANPLHVFLIQLFMYSQRIKDDIM